MSRLKRSALIVVLALGATTACTDPVDKAAQRYLRIHGFEGLSKVAKVHFKNTQKLRERGLY